MNELMIVTRPAAAKQVIKKEFCGGWCHHPCTSFAFEEIIDFADFKLWIVCKLFKEYCSWYHYLRYWLCQLMTCMTNNRNYEILLWSKCIVWCTSHHWNTLTNTDLKDIFRCNFPLHKLLQCKWFSSGFIQKFWIDLFSLSLFL